MGHWAGFGDVLGHLLWGVAVRCFGIIFLSFFGLVAFCGDGSEHERGTGMASGGTDTMGK